MNSYILKFPVILIDQDQVRFCTGIHDLGKWRRKNALDPLLHYGLEIVDAEGNSYFIKKVILKEPLGLFSKLDFLGNSWVQVELELAFNKHLDLEIFKLKSCRILLSSSTRPVYFKNNFPELVQQIKHAPGFVEIFRCLNSEILV